MSFGKGYCTSVRCLDTEGLPPKKWVESMFVGNIWAQLCPECLHTLKNEGKLAVKRL